MTNQIGTTRGEIAQPGHWFVRPNWLPGAGPRPAALEAPAPAPGGSAPAPDRFGLLATAVLLASVAVLVVFFAQGLQCAVESPRPWVAGTPTPNWLCDYSEPWGLDRDGG